MKKIYFIFVLFIISSFIFCDEFKNAHIVRIITNTVSVKFDNGKIYRVIDISRKTEVILRKNFNGKWKRKTIKNLEAIKLLIERGYFTVIKNRGLRYFVATKRYRTIANPPNKYNHSSKMPPVFSYYYPSSLVTSRDDLPRNDIRFYNTYSPSEDRWKSVPYYNDYMPWSRDSIFSNPDYYNNTLNSSFYQPYNSGTPFFNRW